MPIRLALIEAQRHIVNAWLKLGENEGVTPRIGGNVDQLVDLHVIVNKGVDAFVEAEQRDRQRVFPGSEHDREIALRVDKFIRGQRHSVGRGEIGGAFQRPGLPVCMITAVERQKVFVEQRKLRLRRAGHDVVSDQKRKRMIPSADERPAESAALKRLRMATQAARVSLGSGWPAVFPD